MNKVSKLIYALLLALLVCWQLPWLYDFFGIKLERTPFALYSSVIDDFALSGFEEGKGLVRTDLAGNSYTDKEFDEILPFFYVRQLLADQRFPAQVAGRAVSPREAQLNNFIFRSIPSEINKPDPGLYFLLESFSGRLELDMPTDVFRINEQGIEFIDMDSNRLDRAKSELFSTTMQKKGFVFPAQLIHSNPTTRKEYDNGFLLTDAKQQLYHLKMMAGRPFVRPIALPAGMQLEAVWVTEFSSKKILGFLLDSEQQLHVLTANYEVHPLGMGKFDPKQEALTIFGNLLDWTVVVANTEVERLYALDAETYKVLKVHEFRAKNESFGERYRSVLMPIRLQFTSGLDKFVYPRFNF